jgi:multiple antibiotic resistance protein
LLLFTGLKMMNSDPASTAGIDPRTYLQKVSTAIIPVAIPLTTGAGTMSTVILFTQNMHHSHSLMFKLLVAILVMTLIIFFSFKYSMLIMKYLGVTGMDVLTKVFGLITLAIGIQFILDGIKASFPSLG